MLEFDTNEFILLNEVNETLDSVMKETESVYHYSVTDENGEHYHTTDRKGHIIGILEWASDCWKYRYRTNNLIYKIIGHAL